MCGHTPIGYARVNTVNALLIKIIIYSFTSRSVFIYLKIISIANHALFIDWSIQIF